MSGSTQITVPIFDGSDSVDAEDFIHAVRAKAFSEGKDKDQDWILQLVAASLTHDALRWHADLDPEIQNDWGLLQKALLSEFHITFKGVDGAECERFIHILRKRISKNGRAGDNEWITQLVADCVVEDALRWHLDLAPEIQNDWGLLQKAMAAQYPPPEIRERLTKRYADQKPYTKSPFSLLIGTSPIIPIPASAAPAPPSVTMGRIQVIDPGNPSVKTYLSRLDNSIYLSTCQNTSEALIVEYNPTIPSNVLQTKNLGGGYNLLGLAWNAGPNLSSGSQDNARIVGLSGPPSNPATSSYASGGAMRADVWEFASDGTIKVFWTDPNGVKTPLFALTAGVQIILTGQNSYYDGKGWTKKTLVFEAT